MIRQDAYRGVRLPVDSNPTSCCEVHVGLGSPV